MISLGGGRWQCAVCGYQSKSTNLRYHIEAKHSESSGYSCQLCGAVLKTRNSYSVHMSTKHRNKWPLVSASDCYWDSQAIFWCACSFEGLDAMMVPLGAGRWQCSQCGYQASKSTNVRNHIEAKHISSAGYSCQICGSYFKTKNSWSVHMSIKHRNAWNILKPVSYCKDWMRWWQH